MGCQIFTLKNLKINKNHFHKSQLFKKAVICVEASSGSIDLNLFNYDPRGWGKATMKGGVEFLRRVESRENFFRILKIFRPEKPVICVEAFPDSEIQMC